MAIDLSVALILWLGSFTIFGKFIVPRWKLAGKFLFFLATSFLLSYLVSHWSLLWIFGHPLAGIGGHMWWCKKHGINWVTCQPRDKYLELRPWAANDGFSKEFKDNKL